MNAARSLSAPRRLNMLVAGKSGVGKSSLLNYAAGRKVFETGAGEPVTQSYFDCAEVKQGNITYCLYDTKGIEGGNTDEWCSRIFDEVSLRDASESIYDWFHTVVYCISAGDHRIENFEIDVIHRLQKAGAWVVVALTKKDQVSEQHLQALEAELARSLGPQVPVVPVCNGVLTRAGETPPSGLTAVMRASFMGLWRKTAARLPHKAMQVAMSSRNNITLKPGKTGLAVLMALLGVESRIFPDVHCMARLLPGGGGFKSSWLKGSGAVTAAMYQAVGQRGKADVEVGNAFVRASWVASWEETLAVPSQLNVLELHHGYYRDAVMQWVQRWGADADRLVMDIVSGQVKQRFMEYASVWVAEMMAFYNEITHSRKQPLAQTVTNLEWDAMANMPQMAQIQKQITAGVAACTTAAENAGFFFISTQKQRAATNRAYMNLAYNARLLREALAEQAQKVCRAFETELQAYGQYCLQPDQDADRVYAQVEAAALKAAQGTLSADAQAALATLRRALGIV